VEVGNASLDTLRHSLGRSSRPAWVRALLATGPEGDPPLLVYALVLVGPRPAGWQERIWRYRQGCFVAAAIPVRQLVASLTPGTAKLLELGTTVASMQVRDGQFSWQRHPSRAQHDPLQLPWPWMEFQPGIDGFNDRVYELQAGFLVGIGDAPSFPAFGGAFNAFFYDNYTVTGVSNPPLQRLDIRVLDQRAHFHKVLVRATAIDVWIGGRRPAGLTLELNGVSTRSAIEIKKPEKVTLPLPSGLPADAWLWLKQDGEWVDYRSLGGWSAYQSDDVRFETTVDPGSELSALAARGEGEQLEYKVKLPDTREEKRTTFKTVVAFANGSGGTVLFGVSDGDGITGLIGKLPEQRRRLTDMLRALMRPQPPLHIDANAIEGRNVLVLRVDPNRGQLYALVLDTERPEYYVRRDGTTFPAQPEELTQIVAAQAAAAHAFGNPFGLG
jgi:hypothetical protein